MNHTASVRKLRQATSFSQEQLAGVLGTSWVTVSRWERNVASPGRPVRSRLDRLSRLVTRIGKALPPRELYRFLQTPHPMLRGYRPVDLLESEYGFEDLVAFVESAKSGDMA